MPWVDEVKKFYKYSTTYFTYSPIKSGIYNSVVPPTNVIITYRDDIQRKINSNKNYKLTHKIDSPVTTSTQLGVTHFLEDGVELYQTPSGPFGSSTIGSPDYNIDILNFSGSRDYYTYFDSLTNIDVNNISSYWFNPLNSTPGNPHFIQGVVVDEIDFFMNGYKKNNFTSSGWRYDNDEYIWYSDPSFTTIEKTPEFIGMSESFIGSKIPYDTFGYSFDLTTTSSATSSIDGYLISSIDFENWRNGGSFSFNSPIFTEVTSTTGTASISDIGVVGTDKYLVIKETHSNVTTEIKLSNIKISGGYSDSNNGVTSSLSTVVGSTYSYDNGTIKDYSYVGNGKFISGVWEDGVWNSGWRDDDNILELDYVSNAYPVSDKKWRIEIKKSSLLSSVGLNLVNKTVSIGNIVAININEERKLLKNSYLVVEALDDYIVVEAEFLFPIRRIEKDSNRHRISVSENVWLSGAFLNGSFTGIWNDGVFKGNPFNNVMRETQWVDGLFDGGKFESNYNHNDTFTITNTNEIDNTTYPILDLSTTTLKGVMNVGDEIFISNSGEYDGDSIILVIDDVSITIDKEYSGTASGDIKLLLSDGLIQNFKFNDNNKSKLTSIDTLSSSSIFKFNSWIDVNYDITRGVNVGRSIKVLDELVNKNVSKNNLYGYPTSDVLSSVSKFRDSNTLNSKLYNLGTKYKIYTDFIGDSASFDDPFTNSNLENFYEAGWTFSIGGTNSGVSSNISFNRTTPSPSNTNIIGKELEITSRNLGGVLDNTNVNIEKNRYSLVEFDIMSVSEFDKYSSLSGTESSVVTESVIAGRTYPILNLSNINYEVINGTIHNSLYLPVSKNVNHLNTPNRKKVEYFFNKSNLNMDIKGYGDADVTQDFKVVIDNLKMYEVDMIPFFKYFTESNIYRGVQTPFVGVSPFIDFTQNRYPFIENDGIPFESISITTKT